MIGSTLSGKTTYYSENFANYERVSLEQLRSDRKQELEIIEEHLKSGKNIVVDDTNLTKEIRKMHIELAKKYNAKVVGVYMNATRELLARRRWKRSDVMDMIVINKMLKHLEIPEKNEGFDELFIIDQK